MNDFDPAVTKIRAAMRARTPRALEVPGFRRAAVLVPVLNRTGGPTVLFTQRADTLHEHAGQVSFPGGRFEAGENARAAALRESQEEVSLDPSRVEIVGALDDVPSISSYLVTPLVGIVANPPEAFVRQESEVLEPFEVPLSRLLDRSRMRIETWDVSRMPADAPTATLMKLHTELEQIDPVTGNYFMHFFESEGPRVIWGLTARILKQFLDVSFAFSG